MSALLVAFVGLLVGGYAVVAVRAGEGAGGVLAAVLAVACLGVSGALYVRFRRREAAFDRFLEDADEPAA